MALELRSSRLFSLLAALAFPLGALAQAPRVGSEFQVNTHTTDPQNNQSVAAGANGDFVVVWQSDGQDGSSDGVFARRFSSTGAPLGGEFQVNTHTDDYQGDP